MRSIRLIPILFFIALIAACSGEIDEPNVDEPDEPDACVDVAIEPGPSIVRRLTGPEYVRTVADVLGVDLWERASILPRDSYVDGFRNTAWALTVAPAHLDAYQRLASEIAREIEQAPAVLANFGHCETGCEEAFIHALGRRLFRRPVTEDEARRFLDLFAVARAEGEGSLRGALLVVQAMVQSPQFLYRLEATGLDTVLARARVFPDGEDVAVVVAPGTSFRRWWGLEGGDYRLEARLVATGEEGDVTETEVVATVDGEELRRWTVQALAPSSYAVPLTVVAAEVEFALVVEGANALQVEEIVLVGPVATALDVDLEAAPQEVRPVTGYEMASRLSYFIWHSAPDKALLDAAAAGILDTAPGIEAEARRMLESPRARRAFRDYVGEWLHFVDLATAERDGELFPEFGAALVADMKEETYRFLEAIAWDAHRSWLDLFTSRQTFLSPQLAHLYDVPVHPSGWKAHDFSGDSSADTARAGLLTQASFLTSTVYNDETSPVRRGHVVRQRFMCQTIPDPPTNAVMEAPGATQGLSQRERLRVHSENAQCSFCHRLMDPIGFGFEHFDAIGAYRTHDNYGNAVAADGAVVEGRTSTEFDGAAQLGLLLSESPAVEQCLVEQVYQYAMGRPVLETDHCQIQALLDDFRTRGSSYVDMILAIVTSDAFRHVRAE